MGPHGSALRPPLLCSVRPLSPCGIVRCCRGTGDFSHAGLKSISVSVCRRPPYTDLQPLLTPIAGIGKGSPLEAQFGHEEPM